MIQGSPEWHEHRAKHSNASEAGAVMSVSPWFPKTPADLYDLKTGVKEVKMNAAMQHGIDTEGEARVYAEQYFGPLTPAVVTRGRYSASLDGIDFNGTVAVEIKCPSSSGSKLFDITTPENLKALAPHYWYQIVHQFYTGEKLDKIAFVIYHADRRNIVTVNRADVEADFKPLITAWEAFNACMDQGIRPEQEDLDESETFQEIVQRYRIQKLRLEAEEKAFKAIEEEVKAYASRSGKSSLKGFGATISQVTRQGNVDYKKIPELKGVDLDKYRGKSTTYWTVRTA